MKSATGSWLILRAAVAALAHVSGCRSKAGDAPPADIDRAHGTTTGTGTAE